MTSGRTSVELPFFSVPEASKTFPYKPFVASFVFKPLVSASSSLQLFSTSSDIFSPSNLHFASKPLELSALCLEPSSLLHPESLDHFGIFQTCLSPAPHQSFRVAGEVSCKYPGLMFVSCSCASFHCAWFLVGGRTERQAQLMTYYNIIHIYTHAA